MTNEHKLWEFMNNTIITLFSTLEKDEEVTSLNEANLQQFLASLLSNFNNLNILVPPVTQTISQDVQQQYNGKQSYMLDNKSFSLEEF